MAQEVLVFAAASLQDAFDAVIEEYQAQGGGEVSASYASSSTLARQIEQGAPADVFISANPEWMDYLEERGLLRAGSRTDLLGNGLVLVAPPESETTVEIAPGFDLAGALDGGRLAMGDPDHVPAGIYGRAALESLGVWQAVEPQVARADNVRAALALVARGEAPLGMVYRSDAVADDGRAGGRRISAGQPSADRLPDRDHRRQRAPGGGGAGRRPALRGRGGDLRAFRLQPCSSERLDVLSPGELEALRLTPSGRPLEPGRRPAARGRGRLAAGAPPAFRARSCSTAWCISR